MKVMLDTTPDFKPGDIPPEGYIARQEWAEARMEMTHEFFQCACRLELRRLQEDPNCDNGIVHLLCEAVRCSRESCELATAGLRVPTELAAEREKVRVLRETLHDLFTWCQDNAYPILNDRGYQLPKFRDRVFSVLAATEPKDKP